MVDDGGQGIMKEAMYKFTYMHEWLGEALVHEKIQIKDICDDSRDVHVGDVFVDLAKDSVLAEKHILSAIDHGAVAIITSYAKQHINTTIPIIVIPSLREHISALAAAFYDHPSQKMQLIGITGTNGKTTTALLIMQAAAHMGISSAYIGTLGYGSDIHNLSSTQLTTPSALKIQKILHDMYSSGVCLVAMEVSSHALVQSRTQDCSFDVAVFTNLSRDHLDYHQSMFNYAQAKKKLFVQHNILCAIINADDEVGHQFESELEGQVMPFTFKNVTTHHPAAHIKLDYCDKRGIALSMACPWGSGQLVSNLMGDFNAYNLTCAWLSLMALGYDTQDITQSLSLIKHMPGRFEIYHPSPLKPMVIIDYAHTPSALEIVLRSARALTKHHVMVVFGCGGNRDRGKRPLMGQIAERLADRVLLTSDNARDEDPDIIIADILKGMICPWAVEIEVDRGIAINRVIGEAKAGDVVVIAGKGHETVQIIKNKRHNFSDKIHVLNALGMQE